MKTTKKLLSMFMAVLMFTSLFAVNASAAVSIPNSAVTFNGHSYQIYKVDGITPPQAKSYCESLGGYLTTITSSEEQNFVYNYAKSIYPDFDCITIGGTDYQTEGQWRWMNGEKWNYTNWGSGEPNNGGWRGSQDYLQMIADWGGAWDDFYGSYFDYSERTNYYVCEWDTISTSYTATFKDNNGTKTVTGQNITAPSISSKSGWTSVGWTTSSSVPATVTVSAGNAYVLTSNKTFYALYKKDVTLSYNANGGSNAPSSQTQTVQHNSCGITQKAIFNVPSSKPTRDGYTFLGWSSNINSNTAEIKAGHRVELSDNNSTTLYAVWELNTNPDPTPSFWDSFVAFFRNIWNWFISLFA